MEGGGSGEAFGSSTAPLTWHDFLERMRHPSAADFVKSIKSFIVSFSNRAPDPEKDSASVQEFLSNMEEAFRAHTLWAGSSEEELESAGELGPDEGLEKYVMTKLFNRVFASVPEDVNSDGELYEKMALLQHFIRPENLDIKPAFQNETSWLLAQKELQKINMYKAPRDKLVCILNCCKVINNLLINASIASNENPPGADEFLPVLIYVTMKANPPQLHSNLLYIQRYRRQSRLVSEAAYFFTNILSAESFIWNIDAQALSMEEKEFLNKMESARAHLMGTSTSGEDQQTETNLDALEQRSGILKANRELDNSVSVHGHHVPSQSYDANKDVNENEKALTNRLSISDLEKKGAAELLDENTSKYFQDHPFLFANAGDLTIQDVHSLLNCYKKLVLKYVALSQVVGIHKESVPLSTETSSELQTVKGHEYLADIELKNGNAEVSMKNSNSTVDLILPMDEVESKKSIEGSNAETNE